MKATERATATQVPREKMMKETLLSSRSRSIG
jgi:hypothetical protein